MSETGLPEDPSSAGAGSGPAFPVPDASELFGGPLPPLPGDGSDPDEAGVSRAARASGSSGADTPLVGGTKYVRKKRKKRKKKRRIVVQVLLMALIGTALLGLVAFFRVRAVARDLTAARSESVAAADAARAQDLREAERHLGRAQDGFVRGRNTLDSAPELKLLRLIPPIGNNLRAVSAMAAAGAATAEAGDALIESAGAFQDDRGKATAPMKDGRVDVAALQAVKPVCSSSLLKVDGAIATLDAAPTAWLADSLASARTEMRRTLVDLRQQLFTMEGYLEVLPPLLGASEPRRYFVAIGNNAEMNAEGMVLAYGIISASGGKAEWTKAGSVTELRLDEAVSVTVGPDYDARWRWANPMHAWQRVNVSPDFPPTAQIMAAMYKAKTGESVDGVIFIDGVALGYLLKATGPLTFDEPRVTLTAANFAEFAMNRAYFEFGNQGERKDFLVIAAAAAARAALGVSGENARVLGSSLGQAARERRLMVWSAKANEEVVLEGLGLGGVFREADGDFYSYTLENFGGNKLDYYIYSDVRWKTSVDAEGRARVSVAAKIENRSDPASLPDYLLGIPSTRRPEGVTPGEYKGYMTFYAPTGAYLTGGESQDGVLSVIPDAGKAAFSVWLVIPPGETRTVMIEYAAPVTVLSRDQHGGLVYRAEIVPQPRIRADRVVVEVLFAEAQVSSADGPAVTERGGLRYEGAPAESVQLGAALVDAALVE